MLRGCGRHMSGGFRFDFPMAQLPGVVGQNMADFHSNPLGWDTTQLSPSVCWHKAPHYSAFQSSPVHRRPQISPGSAADRACCFFHEQREEGGGGWWRDRGAAVLTLLLTPSPSSSVSLLAPNSPHVFLWHTHTHTGRPLLRRAGWRRSPGGSVTSNKRHTSIYTHNLWNKCLWMEGAVGSDFCGHAWVKWDKFYFSAPQFLICNICQCSTVLILFLLNFFFNIPKSFALTILLSTCSL